MIPVHTKGRLEASFSSICGLHLMPGFKDGHILSAAIKAQFPKGLNV